MRVLQSKTLEERATLKFVSYSGFGEEKFYIENIPGGRFSILGGKFSLYKIIPLGIDSLYREPSGGKVFYIENLPGDYSLWRMLFSMTPGQYC